MVTGSSINSAVASRDSIGTHKILLKPQSALVPTAGVLMGVLMFFYRNMHIRRLLPSDVDLMGDQYRSLVRV